MKSKFIRLFRGAARDLAFPLREQLDQARSLHQQRDHEGAARLYLILLESHSHNADVHYSYGNLLKDQGALDGALASYDRAISLKAEHSHAYCNRAVVLGLLGRHSDALDSYELAIKIDPADSIAHCNRAMLLIGLGQKDEALISFDTAISHDANSFPAHFGRGALLQERKLWAESLSSFDCAVAINPTDAATHYNRAVVAKELKRWDDAMRSCESAMALNPGLSNAYSKRAEILQELKQYPAALNSFDQAIRLNSNDATAYNNRGVLRQFMQRFSEALADHDQSVKLNPGDPDSWFNRGTALEQLDDSSGALASYDRSLALRPTYKAAYVNRGNVLRDEGLDLAAIASYRQAILLDPDFPEAHYNLALATLAVGDYQTGWNEYEWRWRAKGGSAYREKRDFAQPLWLGEESIKGKTVLLYAEQGLGDCLQFCRYVDLVVQLGANVVLEVPRPLVTLLASLAGVGRIVAFGDSLPHFDVQCPLMSLPLAFHTVLKTIPSPSGYLKSDADKASEWQQRLGAKTKPRVGLAWGGHQRLRVDRRRFISLANLVRVLPDDFDYVCLQTEITAADRSALERSDIFQFEGLLRDFSDTAALCACMDLVISVDTSVAHLAGALGKKTWLLLATVADWRWLTDRDDSPWYSSARLFRQRVANGWNGVFERVTGELRTELFRLPGS